MKTKLIILIFTIILFSQCKKREDLIIGKWAMTNIESPFDASKEHWTFDAYNNIEIKKPSDSLNNRTLKYAFEGRKKIRFYKTDGHGTAEYYRIIKLDEDILQLQLVEAVSQTTYEFYREK